MAFQQFARSISVPVPTDQVWIQLMDVHALASCIDVLSEVEEVAPLAKYRAVLEDRLGPFKLRADLDVDITEVESGKSISGRAAGMDRQVASHIRAEARIVLSDEPVGMTTIQIDGSYEVTGKVATLGASSVRKKADIILEQFFVNLQQRCS